MSVGTQNTGYTTTDTDEPEIANMIPTSVIFFDRFKGTCTGGVGVQQLPYAKSMTTNRVCNNLCWILVIFVVGRQIER